MTVGAGRLGAVQSLHAYATAVETAMGHVTTAEKMPIRRLFADGQRRERQVVLHQATQAMNDVMDASMHLRDMTGLRFAIGAKSALVDAKLAYRSLGDVPALATLKADAAAELARATNRAAIVAAMAPTSNAAERAPVRELVGRAIGGDDAARSELRDSILAGVTSDRVIRTADDEVVMAVNWEADGALADELVARILATGDVAAADELLRAATAGWSNDVGASVLDQTVTTPNAARALVGAARRELDRLDDPDNPAVGALVASTRELIDVNARRLGTSAGVNQGAGYLDHPDYAELGRVQASVRLLRSFEALKHAPPPPPPVASASTGVAGDAGERLTW